MKFYIKNSFLFLFTFFSITSLLSQSNELIVYKDFHYFNSRPFLRYSNYEPTSISSYGWAIGYKKMKNERKFNQLEAKVLFDSSDEASAPFKRQEILLNYRKGKYLKKNLFNILKVRYGPSLNINLMKEDLAIGTDREFPIDNLLGGIGLSVFGGLEYKLSHKFNIHIDTSLFGMIFSINTSYYDNPALTERQKRQSGFDFDLFGERILKIGVGYNLGTSE